MKMIRGFLQDLKKYKSYFILSKVVVFIVAMYSWGYSSVESYNRQANSAAIEKGIFFDMIRSSDHFTRITALENFTRVKNFETLREPKIFKMWQWGKSEYPNKKMLEGWISRYTEYCGKKVSEIANYGQLLDDRETDAYFSFEVIEFLNAMAPSLAKERYRKRDILLTEKRNFQF